MSITRVTQSVPNQVFTWMNGPIRLRQHGTVLFFFTKMLLSEQHFCEKDPESSAEPG
jgi:hypothetical protein